MADYLLSAEVAELFNVHPHTIALWTRQGKLSFTQTLGGIRRYPKAEMEALAASLQYHSDFEPKPVSVEEVAGV